MRCLVTGGAGFIGSNLALELEKQGHEVIIADSLFTGSKKNICRFKGRLLDIDVSKPFEVDDKFDAIFHEAAITDSRFGDEAETIRANVDGFKNILKLVKKKDAGLVYASTANLYGNGPVPMKENQEKQLISAYGKSKLLMDELAMKQGIGMHIVGLRYFNVFGPNETNKGRAASMIYHLRNQIKEGKRPRIFKYGEQKRDHIYVKDVVEATIKALSARSGIYNVGTGIATSFNELVDCLNNAMGTSYKPEYFDMPYDHATYQENTQADTSLTEFCLKFKASYSLLEGIKDYLRILDEG
ncbi:MAG TPA: NAD-dependent epimerase/dehydratase family protein [Candidatus Nanoarchaeia archaeon]|nr:NAD-dependent epimerase/dehydratase family protein [Candidatus Nanoarchaeia archaeon]